MLYGKITAFSTYHYHTLIGISNWHISPSFYFIFVYSVQLTVNKCNLENCRWLDSNLGPVLHIVVVTFFFTRHLCLHSKWLTVMAITDD